MVRVFTFLGLLAGTYVGVKALDNIVIWMAERRQANMENVKIERDAAHLKQQLLRELREKQAILDQIPEKHHKPADKHQEQHQEWRDDKFSHNCEEPCTGEVVAECMKCGETFDIAGVPHSSEERDRY